MSNLQLSPLNELFGEDHTGEIPLPLSALRPFRGHPFQVKDDREMELLVESIRLSGVLTPIMVRRDRDEPDRYEILSGHRRKRACELAGLSEIPAVVKELTDEEAVILMVDSNMYREHMAYSEKAFAYHMKNEAMKKQGRRSDLLEGPDAKNTAGKLGAEFSESARTVFRFIRLTYLEKELLQLVDEKKLSFMAGVSLSYLKPHEQQEVLRFHGEGGCLPDANQAEVLKKLGAAGTISYADIEALFIKKASGSPKRKKIVLKSDHLAEFFPENTSSEEMEEIIIRLLRRWQEEQ